MKLVLKSMVLTFCITGGLAATHDTQKTTLILRDHSHRAACYTTFHELQAKASHTPTPVAEQTSYKSAQHRERSCDFGSKWQATTFYNETQNKKRLGEVFGANCKNCIVVGTQGQVDLGTADVENNFLLHLGTQTPEDNTLKGTIFFNPKRTTYGKHVDAYVELDKLIKGLYYKVKVSIIHVKHDLGIKICDEKTGATEFESHRLFDILSGKSLKRFIIDTNPREGEENRQSEQEPLCYAKLPCGSDSRTALSDIESMLGWRFINNKDYFLGLNIAVHAPSAHKPSAEFLWEPRLGSIHWSIGGGLEAGITLWNDHNNSFKILCDITYRYELEECEQRTLGIKNILTNTKRCKHILSHYYLLGEKHKFGLFPAANILTKSVDVTPGSSVDGLLVLTYNWKRWTLDAGYNIFWKEEEKVTLDRCQWKDNTYAIAKRDFLTCETDDPFDLLDDATNFIESDTIPANTVINFCNVDTCVAQRSELLSHAIFGSIGYITKLFDCPLMLALGGGYEFGDDRASADSITFWGKIGMAF